MKKIINVFLFCLSLLTLCACGNKVTTSTCTGNDDMQIIFQMTATNDEIDKIEMIVNSNNEAMEIESFEKLTEAQKEQLKKSFLETL